MEPRLNQKTATWLAAAAAGTALIAWLVLTPPGFFGKLDAIAYAVCHRIPSHSLAVKGEQFPLCARCTGMYLGALLGILYQSRWKHRGGMPTWRQAPLFILLAAAFALDGVNSYLHFFPNSPALYSPTNPLRLVTGTGMGLSISAILVPAFRQTVWQDWQPVPVFSNWAALAGLLGLGALADLAILSGAPEALYPAAVLSTLGVVVVLIAVYTLVWVLLLRRENRYPAWATLAAPLLGGLAVAILQIGLIDLGRFWLTGTWAGFNL